MDVAHRGLNRIVPRHVLQCEGVGVLPGLGQKSDRVERVGRRLFLSFAFLASNDSIDSMATLTIRQLDERTKTRLRVRAAHHGRSMEEEAREILRLALTVPSPAKGNLAESIRRRFRALRGVELQVPQRDAMREPPRFGE
jgi:plasmid stability protein